MNQNSVTEFQQGIPETALVKQGYDVEYPPKEAVSGSILVPYRYPFVPIYVPKDLGDSRQVHTLSFLAFISSVKEGYYHESKGTAFWKKNGRVSNYPLINVGRIREFKIHELQRMRPKTLNMVIWVPDY